MTPLIPLLSLLLGSLITLIASHLTNRSNDRRTEKQIASELEKRRAELLRERGEELYTLIQHWLQCFEENYCSVRDLMNGLMDYDQFLNHVSRQRAFTTDFKLVRVQLLIDVYFPGALESYTVTANLCDEMNTIQQNYMTDCAEGLTDGSPYRESWKNAHNRHLLEGRRLKQSILDAIRKID